MRSAECNGGHAVRILYVITDLKLGGVPLHLLRLARAMKQRGFEPSVVSLSPHGPVSAMVETADVTTAALGARGAWDWRVLERLAVHIDENRPDLIHSFLFHANLASRVACLLSGFPTGRLICEIQTAEIERRWHLTLDRWTQCACRFIVGNSASVLEHLHQAGRIRAERLRLVRGGIDPQPIRQAIEVPRIEMGVTNSDPILLWVGRLDPVKGLDELIEAFGRLRASRAANLVLVGDGAYRAAAEARIRASPFRDNIHLLGARTDVPRLLKAADAFVFPSYTEGLPNALLEAMAAELPCIATDVPGCRDVIRHEVEGLLVLPRDPAALAAAMERVLDDGALAGRLASSAAARVAREFNLASTFDSYHSLYDEALMTQCPAVGMDL